MRKDSDGKGESDVILELARPIARMAQQIMDYYKEPEREKAFQEWYLKRYGHAAPADI